MNTRSHWQIQKAVFLALFFRETKSRFGRFRLGYFWALIEPLSHILVLSLLFSTIRQRDSFYGVPFPIFFATGILAFFVFQKVVMRCRTGISANMGLFGFKQVKPFDAVVVRAAIEILTVLTAMIILLWIGAWFFELQTLPADPLKALCVLFLLALLGLGIAFFASVVEVLYEEWAKFIPQVMRLIYFISGIFFPLAAVPEQFHVYLIWNPALHGLEQFRSAWVAGYPSDGTSLAYLVWWALPAMFLGLWYYRRNQVKVLTL